ncbi:MAG TPA: N-(5'-phosphoribosyl)anthranilate isomerase, partial [Desulfovibrio sp.]|nr:N-(5'-phosphoribosyl)anthranilate isomerase [Desulfovibrio sp.]
MFVKICGMTRQQDLDLASSLGANLCGFIFAQKSPRFITPGAAAALDSHGMARVGVFLTDDNDFILRTAAEARLDFIQLHGRQSSATALAAGPSRVIRVLWPGTYPDAESFQKDLDKASGESAFLLFDAGKQGSG